MNLLFRALVIRLVPAQARTLAAAVLTVSLGVSLALGIRLGTESAGQSLERTQSQISSGSWLGPIESRTSYEAAELARPLSEWPHIVWQRFRVYADHSAGSREQGREIEVLGLSGFSSHGSDGGITQGPDSSDSGPAQTTPEDLWPSLFRELQARAGLQPAAAVTLVAPLACSETLRRITTVLMNDPATVHRSVPVSWRFVARAFEGVGKVQGCGQVFAGPEAAGQFGPSLGQVVYVKPPRAAGGAQEEAEQQLATLVAQIRGFSFLPLSQKLSRLDELTQSMRINLQLMGFVAIIIGVFMVHHVMSVIIVRNRRSFGILKALGVGFRRHMPPLLILALLIGLCASVVGIVGGILCGRFVASLASRSFQALYEQDVRPDLFRFATSELVLAGVLGVLTTLAGIAVPLVRLSRLDAAEVLRSGDVHEHGESRRSALWWAICGVLAAIVAALVLWRFPVFFGRQPVSAYALCFVLLCGSAVAAMPALEAIRACVRWGLRFKHTRKVSRLTTQMGLFLPPQSAVFIQVLLLCYAFTIGVRTMSESFRISLEEWTERTISADLWVRHEAGSREALPLAAIAALESLRSDPNVLAVDGLRVLSAEVSPSGQSWIPIVVSAVALGEQAKVAPLQLLELGGSGELSLEDQKKLSLFMTAKTSTCRGDQVDPCPAYISSSLDIRFRQQGKAPEQFLVRIGARRAVFVALAVVRDFANDSGSVFVDAPVAARLLADDTAVAPGFMNVYLKSKEDSLVEQLRSRVSSEFGPWVEVISGTTLRQDIMRAFEETFSITDALYVLSSVVAMVTVLASLSLQILSRAGDWTLLWATGVSVSTLRLRLSLWSGHASLLAFLLAVPVGLLLASVLVFAVNLHAFGFLLSWEVPWRFIAGLALLSWCAGAFGGFLATRRLREHCHAHRLAPE